MNDKTVKQATDKLTKGRDVAANAERIAANLEKLSVEAENQAIHAEMAVDVDGGSEATSRGAAAYHGLIEHLIEELFAPRFGAELLARYLALPHVRPAAVVEELILAADSAGRYGGWSDVGQVSEAVRHSTEQRRGRKQTEQPTPQPDFPLVTFAEPDQVAHASHRQNAQSHVRCSGRQLGRNRIKLHPTLYGSPVRVVSAKPGSLTIRLPILDELRAFSPLVLIDQRLENRPQLSVGKSTNDHSIVDDYRRC